MSDEYYSAASDSFLFIGTATAVAGETLPAPGSDTFTEVPLLEKITPPPIEQSAASFYVLNDNSPRSVGGRVQEQIAEGGLVFDRSKPTHVSMQADAKVTGRRRNWKIQYPDGTIESFVGFVTKFTKASLDASQDATPHRVDFTIRLDGGSTEV